jgi:ABC-type multidrug transport system ATPase subunit
MEKPSKEALKGISLTIEAGETFGFIGPNGAGKSTLIKILIGAVRSTAGSATLFGRDVRDPEARRGLGFVPENPSLQDFLTPYEILLMGLRLHGLQLRRRAETLPALAGALRSRYRGRQTLAGVFQGNAAADGAGACPGDQTASVDPR